MQQHTTKLQDVEFVEWLTEHKFVSYQQALEDEGYEDLIEFYREEVAGQKTNG